MKEIVFGILISILLFSCETNNFKNSDKNKLAQVSQSDLDYFKNLVGDTILFTVDKSDLRPDALEVLKNQLDWLKDYEYPFRAFTKEQFEEQVKNISNLSINERNEYLNGFREYLRQYDNKEQWVEKYLEIYNS